MPGADRIVSLIFMLECQARPPGHARGNRRRVPAAGQRRGPLHHRLAVHGRWRHHRPI